MTDKKQIKFTIPIPPVTKKNHSQIAKNKYTGKPFIVPSTQYKNYVKECAPWLNVLGYRINQKVNVCAIYYMKTRRKVDLVNLHGALHDVLVDYGVLEDDNNTIVYSTDGSRVKYDKEFPRTEVTITFI